MSALERAADTLRQRFDGLSSRERTLIGAMLTTFVVLGFGLAIGLTVQSSADLTEAIEKKRLALDKLSQQRGTFVEKARERERRDEQLRTNTVRLSSFLEDATTAVGLGRPREFRDSQEPVAGFSAITALRTTVRLDEVTFDQFRQLVDSIARTDELVYIEKVSLSTSRGREAADKIDVEIAVVTYQRGDANKAATK
jgi:hypothetical protein